MTRKMTWSFLEEYTGLGRRIGGLGRGGTRRRMRLRFESGGMWRGVAAEKGGNGSFFLKKRVQGEAELGGLGVQWAAGVQGATLL